MNPLSFFLQYLADYGWPESAVTAFFWLRFWLWVLAVVFFVCFVYLITRVLSLLRHPMSQAPEAGLAASEELTAHAEFEREWIRVTQYLRSDNVSDWKLAILEADTLLDDLTKQLQYPGETLGERLRAIKDSDLHSLSAAWEAHKARNRIAHDGSAYDLSRSEAERIIYLYEQVFREAGYVENGVEKEESSY